MINRVLFYNSGGGIGDAIQILPLISSLKLEFKNTKFFYLCSHNNHFNSTLRDLNCPIETLNLNISYFGFRWWHILVTKYKIKKYKIEKFDLIIDLQSKIRNTFILKMIPHKFFISPCLNYGLSKPFLKIKKNRNFNFDIVLGINKILNTNCKLVDYDTKIINEKFEKEAQRLLPNKNYVGLSITQGNIYRKKEWPINNIINLCKKIKDKNKTIVFFIEKKNTILKDNISQFIPDAIFPEHESKIASPALVTCLGKRLDFAISIDNGIMHMLALSKIPMLVLFGPTKSEKFAPKYNDIIVLDSKKLKKTSNISAINVEDVLDALKQHSNFLY